MSFLGDVAGGSLGRTKMNLTELKFEKVSKTLTSLFLILSGCLLIKIRVSFHSDRFVESMF